VLQAASKLTPDIRKFYHGPKAIVEGIRTPLGSRRRKLKKVSNMLTATVGQKKRNFRALWIQRINAGARINGLTYSQLINGSKKAGLELDRKMLSDLAINQPEAFKAVCEKAQAALAS